MLEIYLLFKWSRQLGEMCRQAGLSAWKYQLLMVACWFGGEFGGLILGLIVAEILAAMGLGIGEILFLLPYAAAIFCAAQAVKYPFRRVQRELDRRNLDVNGWTCGRCGEKAPLIDGVCPMCGEARQPDPQFAGLTDSFTPAAGRQAIQPPPSTRSPS